MAMFFGALQGVLINVMTPSAFRRVSPWIQMISMTILVMALLITPGIAGNVQVLVESHTRALDYIPLFWFLGLYETLNPEGTLIPASSDWAATAISAMLIVGVVFALTYLISYRRYSRKILEGVESNVFTQPWYQRASAWVLSHSLLRHPFERASFYFIGRIFGRSSKHRLFIAMYGGIGLAITVTSLFVLRKETTFVLAVSQRGLMEAPLILCFFVVSGLRATFNIPYELPANWIFQMTSGTDPAEHLKATRKWVFLRGIVPVYLLFLPVGLMYFDISSVIFQVAFGLVVSGLLAEVFFFRFNKVPFTCSYLPAKSHLAFLAGAYVYGFTNYIFTIANLERWAGATPQHTIEFFVFTGAVLGGLSWYRRNHDRIVELVYEDDSDPLVRQLNLT
jgi:hypothetical protein